MLEVMEILVAGRRYGLPLERVVEVAPRVNVEPLPRARPPLLGYCRYRGAPLPVVDLRLRLGQTPVTTPLEEHLVVARTKWRPVALLVDRAVGLRVVDPAKTLPPPASADVVAGVVALDDGLLFITDLDAVLSLEEERALDEDLARLRNAPS